MQNSEYSFLFDEHFYYKLNVLRQLENTCKINMFKEGSIINTNIQHMEFSDELYTIVNTCFNIYDKPQKEHKLDTPLSL